jgi:YHS domain-containing protein
MARTHLGAAIFAAVLMAASPAAAVSPVNKTFFGGVAIDGYDPVAYFTMGRAVEGSKQFSIEWRGATWRFVSARHRDRFVEAPESYAPQYGGYCAWAVAHGSTADIDPQMWTIHEGKLYLNYDREIQAKWLLDKVGLIERADAEWPQIVAP